MQTQVISISPSGIENGHEALPFDVNIFKIVEDSEKTRPDRQVAISDSKVRRSLIIDGELLGYVHTLDFALEVVRTKFNQKIKSLFQDKQVQNFQVKYEVDEEKDRRTCKLYQVSPGFIYNGRNKLCTIQIDLLHRIELSRNSK